MWVWSIGGMVLMGRNQNTCRETCPPASFTTTESHMNCPGIEPKPLQVENAWTMAQSQMMGTVGLNIMCKFHVAHNCHITCVLVLLFCISSLSCKRMFHIHSHSSPACMIFNCAHVLAARSSPGSLQISMWPHCKVSFGLYAQWRCETDINGSPAASQSGYHSVRTYVTLWCVVISCVTNDHWSSFPNQWSST